MTPTIFHALFPVSLLLLLIGCTSSDPEQTPIPVELFASLPQGQIEVNATSNARNSVIVTPQADLSTEPKQLSADHTNKAIAYKTLPDFSQYTNTSDKKRAFFSYLTDLSKHANQAIMQLRSEISALDPSNLLTSDATRLNKLVRTYKVTSTHPYTQQQDLLAKIHPIPAPLVLAQAANESAWGTSRFAVMGNNLFGQWCFKQGCGIVPSGRPAHAKHEVRVFATPLDSVHAYMRNLNSHGSYKSLRQIRTCLMSKHQKVSGRDLSYGLMSYSSRGLEYIKEIQQLIRHNKLEPWQDNWWGKDTNHPCYASLPKVSQTH